MGKRNVEKFTSILKKYPTHRDDPLKSCWKYMQGRRKDDSAEGLWRVGDKLYDLNSFIEKHPGGQSWLVLTKGTDVTEAFETHHITEKATLVLKKFYIREASKSRNFKFLYPKDGFYKTLKRRVAEKITKNPKAFGNEKWKSKLITDLNLVALFMTSILAVCVESIALRIIWTLIAGQCMAWSANFSHNFMHQKDNWRMYTANFSLFTFRDFRVFHVMSHHMFPNTNSDLEVTGFENALKWIPFANKSKLEIYVSWLISPLSYSLVFVWTATLRYTGYLLAEVNIWYWDELISFLLPAVMMLFGRPPYSLHYFLTIYFQWIAIELIGSFLYNVFAINNGHHGPEVVHEGDEFESLDFGIFQIKAIVDRRGFDDNLFAVLGYFGLHVLHHLFPTLDHADLPILQDIFNETCKEFSVTYKQQSAVSALKNQFKQLARSKILHVD